MRLSKVFLKTYKEAPKEAEVISHKLMLRASMIRQLTRGVYSYLPLGYKVLKKIENIVREEMDRAGSQEILMPVLQPASLWEESGRWFAYGSELMRMKDRNEREFALGPTHEEVVTDIVRNTITSYKELPFNLYQIQTKFRDEMRPRFGLMRGREFLMKDAYSFHLTKESLDEEFLNMKNAYSRILERMELKFRAVDADSGSIGGDASNEFMVLAENGEDDILYSDSSDYAANVEKATSIIELKESSEEKLPKELVETPNTKTIKELSEFLNIPEEKTVKAVMLKEVLEDKVNYVLALIRGDLDVNEIKLKNAVNASMELEMMTEEECEKFEIVPGFAGSYEKKEGLTVVIDETVKYVRNFALGANKKDYHFINVNLEDLHYDVVADIRTARAGDISPDGKGVLKIARGMEVGHIFKLGDKYSKALDAKVLDENGKQQVIQMGCYGIGVSRLMSAVIEQKHDDFGIIWPKSIAPYIADVIIANVKDETQVNVAERIYEALENENIDIVLDDRNERAGFKFKDADLIGFPLKIVAGKGAANGIVEVKDRATGESVEVKVEEVVNFVKEFLAK
ncbi:proline--tRNA ligase [Leptotrichia sp. oral taxon 221]|uniref:proline--tRNA ligase n=1 Tax=Leptotrichia sp. oral taxon 221 TaxID=712362 RepID=UPI001B8CEE7F|nr:proline--tRNA ligase [Leptotrichia sp. oral taxon 221]QUB96879.1 proline--tRNA ligase [Leptotrichia sp. oral taxon 221]